MQYELEVDPTKTLYFLWVNITSVRENIIYFILDYMNLHYWLAGLSKINDVFKTTFLFSMHWFIPWIFITQLPSAP